MLEIDASRLSEEISDSILVLFKVTQLYSLIHICPCFNKGLVCSSGHEKVMQRDGEWPTWGQFANIISTRQVTGCARRKES